MLYLSSFLTVFQHFSCCFRIFPLVFLQFRRFFLQPPLFPILNFATNLSFVASNRLRFNLIGQFRSYELDIFDAIFLSWHLTNEKYLLKLTKMRGRGVFRPLQSIYDGTCNYAFANNFIIGVWQNPNYASLRNLKELS